jgi:hypothetical protein
MPVTGDLQPGLVPTPHVPLTGTFRTFHTLVGDLEMTGDRVHLSATYADGQFSNWSYTGPDGVVVQLDLTPAR